MKSSESYSGPIIEHATSEHGAYSILDLPSEALPSASRIVDILKERSFLVHLLQGDDKPLGMRNAFGVWPHPSEADIALISEEAKVPIYTTDELTAWRRAEITAA